MLYRTIALVACLCAAANAFVDYGDAILYDEYDLQVRTFPIPECLFASCKVYVSAPESSLPTLAQIYIGDTPLATLARKTDSEKGLKTPYNIKGYSGKAVFSNFNVKTPYTKFITAPVAVYVVYERATFFNTALVYEPSSTPVTVNWSNATTLTLLSATNFTAKGEVKQGVLAFGRVVSAGFDSVQRNLARIPALYEFSDDKLTLGSLLKPKTFHFSANTPLITLYSPFAASSVDVTIVSGFLESSSSPLFLTSPGYTGVLSGQVYRSSLYPNSVQYRLAYEQEATVHFKTFLNTFTDAVELTVDGGEKQTLRGTRGLSSYHQLFDVNGKDLEISFTKFNLLSSFLLRIAAEVEEPETTHRTPEEVKELIKDLLKNHTRAPTTDGPDTTHRTPEEIKELIKDLLKNHTRAPATEAPETTHKTPEEIKELIKDLLKNHTRRPSEDVTEAPESPDESTHRTPEEIKNLIKGKLKNLTRRPEEPATEAPEVPEEETTHRTPEEVKNLLKNKLKERLQATAEPIVA